MIKKNYKSDKDAGDWKKKEALKRKRAEPKPSKKEMEPAREGTRLNKYIAHAGICSRREADKMILSGIITINGKVVNELGTMVKEGDVVRYAGDLLKNERLVYLLLNKPKDFITTVDDPQNRRTVMELVKNACKERTYPVGRLDRATTGLLLFTNDGDLATKLCHPKYKVKKIYAITTDKSVSGKDLRALVEGIELEDGKVWAEKAEYVEGEDDRKHVGIELSSGKNRVIRRMFEHLGYKVVKLDRVSFAGLTKKNLPRGKWRFLTEKEITFLKRVKK